MRLLRQSQRSLDAALAPLLAALNETGTCFPGTQLRLVYEFVTDEQRPDDAPRADAAAAAAGTLQRPTALPALS